MKRYFILFTNLLQDSEGYILETAEGRFRLTAGISESYILANLSEAAKQAGSICVEEVEASGQPCLLPLALVDGDGLTTWITITERNDLERLPLLTDFSRIASLKTESGAPYADGFINASRTLLSHEELMAAQKQLRHYLGYYAKSFYLHYAEKHPDQPYDVRLHFPMIQAIRKHKHYTDDFANRDVHPYHWYHNWSDPFPWQLMIQTFGGTDSYPSYARLRMMADTASYFTPAPEEAIQLALRVLNSSKAPSASRHYAAVLASTDPRQADRLETVSADLPRARIRIAAVQNFPLLYELALENAGRLASGDFSDDWLDDPRQAYTGTWDPLETFRIAQRGYVRLAGLDNEQVGNLCRLYMPLVMKLSTPLDEEERHDIGNAVRSFMIALIGNRTEAFARFFMTVYDDHNSVLYGTSAMDSHQDMVDEQWRSFLYDYAAMHDLLPDFCQRLIDYLPQYERDYASQTFFVSLLARVGYHILPKNRFYELMAEFLAEDYDNVVPISAGICAHGFLPDDAPALDYRWELLLFGLQFYAWREERNRFYACIRSRIDNRPEGAGWENVFPEGSGPEDMMKEDYENLYRITGDEKLAAFEGVDWDGEYLADPNLYDDDDYDIDEDWDDEDGEDEDLEDDEPTEYVELTDEELADLLKQVTVEHEDGPLLDKPTRLAVLEIGEACAAIDGLMTLTEAEIAGHNEVMKQLAFALLAEAVKGDDLRDHDLRLYWTAFRHYLAALAWREENGSPSTEGAAFWLWVYNEAMTLFYARGMDAWGADGWEADRQAWWLKTILNFARSQNINLFFDVLDTYFNEMDEFGYPNHCYSYISLYGALAFILLSPDAFHQLLSPYVESNFMFLTTFTQGLLLCEELTTKQKKLDARWQETFNRWEDTWEFDEAINAFDVLKDYFDVAPAPTRDSFFRRFPRN